MNFLQLSAISWEYRLLYGSQLRRDAEGNINMQAKEQIRVDVAGAGVLQGFGSADPDALNRYDSNICETYDGSVLAVIRAGILRVAKESLFSGLNNLMVNTILDEKDSQ